jgi:TP901 family phage tail tape measure protein
MAITLMSLLSKLELDTSPFKSSLDDAQQQTKSAGDVMTSVGGKLTAGLTLPIVGVGLAAVKTATDFEAQMNILSVAARSSGTTLQELSAAALAVGGDTELVGINASQAADAMTSFYKAGLSTTDMFGDLNAYLNEGASLSGAMRAAVDLQAASELDLATASDVVAIAMATFGLKAEDAQSITDSFVRTADASVASVGELAAAMTNVGPTAATFGWSLQDVNTALGILSERGIRGSEAGTALKSMMTNIMRPTEAVTLALNALGIELYTTEGTMRSLPDIMGQFSAALEIGATKTRTMSALTEDQAKELGKLRGKLQENIATIEAYKTGQLGAILTDKERASKIKSLISANELLRFEMNPLLALEEQHITVTETMTEAMRNQYVQTLAGTYGMKAMNTLLTEGTAGWQAMEGAVATAASAQEVATVRTQGLKGAWETLSGVIETFMITVGTPLINNVLTPGVRKLTELMDAVMQLDPKWINLGVSVAGFLAVIGPLLVMLGIMSSGFGVLGSVLTILLGPVGLVIAAVALLAIAWATNWQGIQEKTQTALAVVREVVDFSLTLIKGLVLAGLAAISAWWNEHYTTIQQTTQTVLSTVQTIVTTVITEVTAFIQRMVSLVTTWWVDNYGLIQQTTETVITFIHDKIVATLTAIQTFWQYHGDQIMFIVRAVWGIVQLTVETVIQAVLGIIRAIMQVITGDWSGAWETIKATASTVWDNIRGIVTIASAAVKTIVLGAIQLLKELLAPVWEAIKTKIAETWQGIVTVVADRAAAVKATILEKIHEAKEWVMGQVSHWKDVGWQLLMGLRDGVLAAVGGLISAVKGAVTSAIQAAKNLLGISSPSKVFEGIGSNMVLGLASGWEGQWGRFDRLLSGSLGGLTGTYPLGMQGMGSAGAGSSVTNNWTVNASYSQYQDELSLRDTVRLLQMGVA